MSASKQQGAKAARREKHLQREQAMRERKALRRKRAAIHDAMGEAAKMARSKRKGCRDFEANMATLGFEPRRAKRVNARTGEAVVGRSIRGDVLEKYEQIR